MIQRTSFQGCHPPVFSATKSIAARPVFAGKPPERLKAFQDVLTRSHILQDYEVDLFWAYPHLSERAQNFVDKITAYRITPAEVETFQQQRKLGFIEEAADLIFEYYTLRAGRQGILSRKNIQGWATLIERGQADGIPFFQLYTKVRDGLDNTQIEKFQRLTRLSAQETRNLLGLMAMKFGLLHCRGIDYKSVKYEGRINMRSEMRELIAPGQMNVGKIKLWLLSHLYSLIPGLSAKPLAKAARRYVTERVGVPVQHNDLMKNVFLKQLTRQELDFEHADWRRPEDRKIRKRIWKPFEELVEAAILKDCIDRVAKPKKPSQPAQSRLNSI